MPTETTTDITQPPPDSAAALLEAILRRQAEAFAQEYAALQDSDDPEHPHRARVALRRLRAAVSGFAPVLDDRAAKRLSRRARSLFRLLGPLRDADVAAASFARGEVLRQMLDRAATIRTETRHKMAAAGAAGFAASVDRALATQALIDTDHGPHRLAQADAALLGAQALQVAWTAARAYGATLSGWDDFTRHEFRKDIKTLRYIAEFFGDRWPGKPREAFLARLTRLQDALGEMNDIAVHFAGREPDDKTRRRFAKAMEAAESHWGKLLKLGPWWGVPPAAAD